MTLIVDAAPLVALADRAEPLRNEIISALTNEPGALVIPAPVTAEIDYLLGRRFGRAARHAFLADLAAGRFTVDCLDRDDYTTVLDLDRRYKDLGLGLADCSIVAIARRRNTARLLSFNERHFRAVTSLAGDPFTILPADDSAMRRA